MPGSIEKKFKQVTDAAVELLDLDFCRIWMVKPADLCNNGCIHAATVEGPNACRRRDQCLHLMASSDSYTYVDGNHCRVPFGAYKIGGIASGEDNKFLTNSVTTDPQVDDHQWAKSLGLVSFAGYKLHDANGDPLGVLAMFAKHPVSEEDDAFMSNLAETTSRVILRHQVAEELEKTRAQAVEANRAKSRFLASMSHEIRTPMTSILGYADLLMDSSLSPSTPKQLPGRDPPQRGKFADADQRYSRPVEDRGRQALARRAALRRRVALGRRGQRGAPRAEERGVSLAVEYSGPMPETILTDGARLRQAVLNLASNAVKFTEQGSVRIVASFLPRLARKPAGGADRGDRHGHRHSRGNPSPAIPAFHARRRGRSSQKFGGTGLGLAISHEIARFVGRRPDRPERWDKEAPSP